jgi:hypothetical protein
MSCATETQCAPRPLIFCMLLFIRRSCERITAAFPDYRKATVLPETAYAKHTLGNDLQRRATRTRYTDGLRCRTLGTHDQANLQEQLQILPGDSHPRQVHATAGVPRTRASAERTIEETLQGQWLLFSLWPLRVGRSFDHDAPGGEAPAELRWSEELRSTACHQGHYSSSLR